MIASRIIREIFQKVSIIRGADAGDYIMAKRQPNDRKVVWNDDGTANIHSKAMNDNFTVDVARIIENEDGSTSIQTHAPDEMVVRGANQGVMKLIFDRTGGDTPENAFERGIEILAAFKNGDWGQAGGGGTPTVSPAILVAADLTGLSVPAAQKAWGEFTKEKREAFKVKYATEIESKKQEVATDTTADLSSLL